MGILERLYELGLSELKKREAERIDIEAGITEAKKDVEHDVIAKDLEVENEESYLASEKGAEELLTEAVDAEEEAETSELILNKSDSNMNNTKETDPDEEYNEDNMDAPEDSFRLILEDTPV